MQNKRRSKWQCVKELSVFGKVVSEGGGEKIVCIDRRGGVRRAFF